MSSEDFDRYTAVVIHDLFDRLRLAVVNAVSFWPIDQTEWDTRSRRELISHLSARIGAKGGSQMYRLWWKYIAPPEVTVLPVSRESVVTSMICRLQPLVLQTCSSWDYYESLDIEIGLFEFLERALLEDPYEPIEDEDANLQCTMMAPVLCEMLDRVRYATIVAGALWTDGQRDWDPSSRHVLCEQLSVYVRYKGLPVGDCLWLRSLRYPEKVASANVRVAMMTTQLRTCVIRLSANWSSTTFGTDDLESLLEEASNVVFHPSPNEFSPSYCP